MITRPEINAINSFDAMEWLQIHHCKNLGLIGTLDIKQRGDRDPIREFQVSRFLAWCEDYQEQVEESSLYYLAGPYNSYVTNNGQPYHNDFNINEADRSAHYLWSRGVPVFTPHLNTRHFQYPRHRTYSDLMDVVSEETVVKGYIDNLYRFSGLILIYNWWYSTGTKMEIKKALEIGKLIFSYKEIMEGYWKPMNNELDAETGDFKCSIKENG